MSLTPVALEEGISDMTQSWKSWSLKLGLGIAVATSAVFCGNYVLAENTQEFLESSGYYHPDWVNLLRLTSLTSDVPASNVNVKIKETGVNSGPYALNAGNPVTLNTFGCFGNTVTVQLYYQVSPTSPQQIIGERMITFNSSRSIEIRDTQNGANYTINYQITSSSGNCM
ncbi:hypothetical protein SAMD00079811_53440 [Scytonema sp. HK-05]|uniref:hypothetical protein n=1 Tax=Scytonema sp. HK-05 TaxID=1137095 RepID=UPI00093604AA|nr:hypothetical protein [Scytonema sp. HK-05]OKH55166.1 hypothetical protein NIES2130_27230 [Scytonema sp. HK-05]BAY47725.1 hypothetical protein SAMD00079811_53440 [Scytonema sp. HK-05]